MKQLTFCLLMIYLLLANQVFSQRLDKEAIPPEFNCKGCILVILKKNANKGDEKAAEVMQDKFLPEYEGKYVFISPDDLGKNPKYQDENIYHFVLDPTVDNVQSSRTVTKANGAEGEFNYKVAVLNFHLYDRVSKKGYAPFFDRMFNWPKTINNAVEALNKALKKL